MATATFTVLGMTCDHCVRAVAEELRALDSVTDVQVDLESGLATVTSEGSLDPAVVKAAIDEAGYEVAP